MSGLPPALDGLRVGLITDLHHSEMVPVEDVVRASALLMAERPDLIALGGDYVSWGNRSYVVPCAEALAGLRAPFGVFAVLGNHDDERHVPAALMSQGFEVLRDARTAVIVRGERLDLAGLRFWTSQSRNVARVLRGAEGPIFLIAHHPSRLNEAAELDVPLVLSGHTHGGQVVLPGIGAIGARKFPVVAGVGHRDNTSILSRGGNGTFLSVQPTDVSVITLTPLDKPAPFKTPSPFSTVSMARG